MRVSIEEMSIEGAKKKKEKKRKHKKNITSKTPGEKTFACCASSEGIRLYRGRGSISRGALCSRKGYTQGVYTLRVSLRRVGCLLRLLIERRSIRGVNIENITNKL